jgi:hypothetical protein
MEPLGFRTECLACPGKRGARSRKGPEMRPISWVLRVVGKRKKKPKVVDIEPKPPRVIEIRKMKTPRIVEVRKW